MKTIDFSKLVGSKATLYPCTDLNSFQLGSVKFEVIEDELDGYRSITDEVVIVDSNMLTTTPLDTVTIIEIDDGYFEGFGLVEEEHGHLWLKFGTVNYDDYYPYFVFDWTPKTPIINKQEDIDYLKSKILE